MPDVDIKLKESTICFAAASNVVMTPVSEETYRDAGMIAIGKRLHMELLSNGE